jgi:dCTP deaminase
MILTGAEIGRQIDRGAITFRPYDEESLNPNSINYRLGPLLKVYQRTDAPNDHVFAEIFIPPEGHVLEAGRMYLGHTLETIGSDRYAMSLIGRSSIGRLGLFVQASANLGHTTSCHRWTLELVATRAIRVYPAMRIGQVSFWTNRGGITRYRGWYGEQDRPQASRLLAGAPGARR